MKSVFAAPVLFLVFLGFSSFFPVADVDYESNPSVAFTPGVVAPALRPATDAFLYSTTTTVIRNTIAYSAKILYDSLQLHKFGLPAEAFEMAMIGYQQLLSKQLLNNPGLLCIADLSQSSTNKRLYVIDVSRPSVLYRTWVAHGRNSGKEYAQFFSNRPASNQSSLGFYVTGETYYGSNGYSLKLQGMEQGFNDKAEKRVIVMHAASYVSEQFIEHNGFLGRSQGCPAVSQRDHKKVIDMIKHGACLFIYHPSHAYLKKSRLIKEDV